MVQLKRSRLFEQVVDVLEERIRDRELVAGAELPSERQLMAEFGVGRTAIREALFHLQRAGLVDLRAGSRARVTAPDADVVMTSLSSPMTTASVISKMRVPSLRPAWHVMLHATPQQRISAT